MPDANLFRRELGPARLNQKHPTKEGNGHFVIYYGLRNPREGLGLGPAGVDEIELVHCYDRALETAYDFFVSRNWAAPRGDARFDNKIPVFIHDPRRVIDSDRPFTFTSGGVSKIGLRADNGEPSRDLMLRRAEIEATHEVAHVFCHRHRPPMQAVRDPWKWFDEATAHYTERVVFPSHSENLRFSGHWSFCPEQPLDDPSGPGGNGRSASWFVQFLAIRFGDELLRDSWHSWRSGERPFDTLERLLAEKWGRTLASPDPVVADLFGAMYSVESYFDEEFNGRVVGRFGTRCLAESIAVDAQQPPICRQSAVQPAACCYYRFNVYRSGLTLRTELSSPRSTIKASLVEAVDRRSCAKPTFFSRSGTGASISATITTTRDDSVVILIIANTDLKRTSVTREETAASFELQVTVT